MNSSQRDSITSDFRGSDAALWLGMLVSPAAHAPALSARPRWLKVFLLLAALDILSLVLGYQSLIQAAVGRLPVSAGIAGRAAMERFLEDELPATIAFLPFNRLLRWGGLALLLSLTARAWGARENTSFRQMFALSVFAASPAVFGDMVGAVLSSAGLQSQPGFAPFGIDIAVPSAIPFHFKSALNSINPFSIWQVLIVIPAISSSASCRRSRAALIVVTVSLFAILASLAISSLVHESFQLGF